MLNHFLHINVVKNISRVVTFLTIFAIFLSIPNIYHYKFEYFTVSYNI